MSIEEDEDNKKMGASKKNISKDSKKSRPKSAGKKNKNSDNEKGGPLSGLHIAMTG